MIFTNTDIKKIAQAALKSEYGFAPILKDITLLESCEDGTYILFKVAGHEYSFDSYVLNDGIVWVGANTIEKRS